MKRWFGMRTVSGLTGGGLARRTWIRRLILVAGFGLSSYLGLHVSNAQLTILHNFGDTTPGNEWSNPLFGLIQAPDGNFYGTTYQSPKGMGGSTYQITAGGAFTTIYHFPFVSHKRTAARLLYYNGELIAPVGTKYANTGPLLAATSLSGVTSILYKFSPSGVQTQLSGLIVGSDGNLYGTSSRGGSSELGTIYKISPTPPYTVTVLYTFSSSSEGFEPEAELLLAKDGNYYGTTNIGRPTNGGTIYQMTPAGQVTFLYEFPGATDYCQAPLIQDANGNFYGSTIEGGTFSGKIGGGYVFKMSPTFQVTILHQFGNGTDGSWPSAVVLGPNGNLYGTTMFGGTGKPAGWGTVFELSTDGSSYTVLHNFADGSVPNDGRLPNSPLIVGSDNNLYGTTDVGGTTYGGTIFRISP
ncbi:MAG: hypothetical protein JOZ31_06755 [Verrucomicrobia bacterium]|nr:hypothetical protein [Verrucomicrobiota bacterium]MBV8484142.1 hypothetical protein [Verrucomicrobiota bacterium]